MKYGLLPEDESSIVLRKHADSHLTVILLSVSGCSFAQDILPQNYCLSVDGLGLVAKSGRIENGPS